MKIKQISARVFYNSKHNNNTVYVKINDSTDELVFSFDKDESGLPCEHSTSVRSKTTKLPVTGIHAQLTNNTSEWLLEIVTEDGLEDHAVTLIPTENHDGLVGTGTLGITVNFNSWMEQYTLAPAPVIRKMLHALHSNKG